jgi:hypothetical protein
MSKADVIKKDVDDFLASPLVAAFETYPLLQKKWGRSLIEKEIRELADGVMASLPDSITQADNYEKERSVQTAKESQTQTSTQVDTSKDIDVSSHFEVKEKEIVDDTPVEELTWPSKGLYSKAYYLNNPSLVSPLQTVLQNDLNQYALNFSKDLLCSRNLCYYKFSFADSVRSFFGLETFVPFKHQHKNFNMVLVVEEIATGKIRHMLIDENDEKQFKHILLQEANEPCDPEHEVRIALYDLYTGHYMHGNDPIDLDRLKANPTHKLLKAQAKFFKGEMNYDDEEIGTVDKWLESVDTKAMATLFTETILPWRSATQEEFAQSDIAQIFTRQLNAKTLSPRS